MTERAAKNMEKGFTHFDQNGNAVMVDVSGKQDHIQDSSGNRVYFGRTGDHGSSNGRKCKEGRCSRSSKSSGNHGSQKNFRADSVCHPLPIQKCSVDYELDQEKNQIHVFCTVKTEGKTGVEMEALTGVQVTLLTIYDMCKAIDKHMVMSEVHLVEKTGGKSGDFRFENR